METQKTILLAALFFLTYLMWQSWNETFPSSNNKSNTEVSDVRVNNNDSIVPAAESITNIAHESNSYSNVSTSISSNSNKQLNSTYITVKTDAVEYKIDTVGGDIVEVKLLKYNNSLEDKTPMTLLNNNSNTLYIAPNGLTGELGPDTQQARAIYNTEKENYILNEGEDLLRVNLTLNKNNTVVTKSFVFKRNSYDIDIEYTIQNNSDKIWNGNIFSVLKRTKQPSQSSGFIGPTGYVGLAAYSIDNKFHKLSPDNLSTIPTVWNSKDGWVAMLQHYFLSTWIPNKNEDYKYIAKSNADGTYMVTMISPSINVQPGQSENKSIKFYAGPEKSERLSDLATGLNRTVDYGIMWPVASVIFLVMSKIYDFVGNWGWAIILVTVLIKLLFYRLSSSSYRSMAKLRLLAPKIEQMRKRYGEDREKMGKAMMELYKKEKVNPLGGCLPMLIQLPFFIALYWVIIESVELRHAPFVLWIQDLSVKDPYFILPILMGVSMLAQQKLSPAPADPTQEKVMMMMPIMFTVMFMFFPAGLVLYWVINTVTSIAQQWWIMRTVDADAQAAKQSRRK